MKKIIEEYTNLKQRIDEVDTDKLWEYYIEKYVNRFF